MLMKLKLHGAKSSAGGNGKRGNKGRLELFAEKTNEGFSLKFLDFGNYGRVRWTGDFGELGSEELDDMIFSLTELRDGGEHSTRWPQEIVDEIVRVSSEGAAPISPTSTEAAAEPAEELESDTTQTAEATDTDQLTA